MLILATLQLLKYNTAPNGVILKVLKPSKMIKTHFYRLYSRLSFKSMTPNVVVVVNVLLPICCHIGSGMPNMGTFFVALLGAMTDKWFENLSVVRIRT